MIVRVTEQVASVQELSYDVRVPVPAAMRATPAALDSLLDDVEEHLDRATDEVHRVTLRVSREITSTEIISP